jgi:CHASE2 domain-containing sensor protein
MPKPKLLPQRHPTKMDFILKQTTTLILLLVLTLSILLTTRHRLREQFFTRLPSLMSKDSRLLLLQVQEIYLRRK